MDVALAHLFEVPRKEKLGKIFILVLASKKTEEKKNNSTFSINVQ
jgi:hypothetical protein